MKKKEKQKERREREKNKKLEKVRVNQNENPSNIVGVTISGSPLPGERGNTHHSSKDGRFTAKQHKGIVRKEEMKLNLVKHVDSDFGGGTEEERTRKAENALYDGGLIAEKDGTLHGFLNVEECETFVRKMTGPRNCKDIWKSETGKGLVRTYVKIIYGYIESGNFDIIPRNENHYFLKKYGKKEIGKMILEQLSEDTFSESGLDRDTGETVCMIFRQEMKSLDDRETFEDMYIKFNLIAENGKEEDKGNIKKKYQMKILSFHDKVRGASLPKGETK